MWSTLANGDIQTTVQFLCLTLHVDRYIRYIVRNKTGVVCSGSEDTLSAAIDSASAKLRSLLSSNCVQKDEIDHFLSELTRVPIPLTKPTNHIHAE